ncbi:MAG TPA: DUF6504 family protein [Ktedonobacterales bacterium]
MAHRYHDPILVRRAPGASSAPAAFKWRDAWYEVDATLATWRLRDRWWAAPAADVASGADDAADATTPTERVYYRVRCLDPEGEQIFDLYHDAARGQWVLDRAHD